MAVVSSCCEMFGLVLLTNATPIHVHVARWLTLGHPRTLEAIIEKWSWGDYVKSLWPLWAGLHTCYNGDHSETQRRKSEPIFKNHLSSDCSLQLENIKLESLVIADQHAAVNSLTSPVHTARQVPKIGNIRSKGDLRVSCSLSKQLASAIQGTHVKILLVIGIKS